MAMQGRAGQKGAGQGRSGTTVYADIQTTFTSAASCSWPSQLLARLCIDSDWHVRERVEFTARCRPHPEAVDET